MRFTLTPSSIGSVIGSAIDQTFWLRTGLLVTYAWGLAFSMASDLGAENTRSSDMVNDLKFLTSEELAGRSSVDPTIQVAAKHLSDRFEAIGLDTNLFAGSAMQEVEIPVAPTAASAEANQLAFVVEADSGTTDSGTTDSESSVAAFVDSLQLATDFMPMAIGSTKGTVRAPLVWAGYGITAEDYQYDDYAGIDVQGKVVMILRKEPGAGNPASPFDGVKNTRHAFFATKIATAIDAGAAAVIMVNDAESADRKVKDVQKRQAAESRRMSAIQDQLEKLPTDAVNVRTRLTNQLDRVSDMIAAMELEVANARRGLLGISEAGASPLTGSEKLFDEETGKRITRPAIPVVSLTRDVVDQLLKSVGRIEPASLKSEAKDLQGLEQIELAIDSDWRPRSFEIPDVTVRLDVQLTPAIAKSSNVVGTLAGAGSLANEVVVIGAHYDHVGMGGRGSLAPGTVAIHNGADDNASGTAVLLQSAERLVKKLSGLQNRRRLLFIAFTGEERGLLGSKHYVKYPRFPIGDTVAMVNMDMVGRLQDNELTVYGTESASVMNELLDQANQTAAFDLFRVGSGYGPSDHSSFYEAGIPVLFFFTGLHSDYHRPSDDFDKLNLDGMSRITDIVCQVSERLATMPERPVYTQTEKNVQIRRQLAVFMGVKLSQQPGEVVFSSVLATGPAAAGGLVAGDRLVAIAGKSIEEVDQVFDVLRKHSAGDALPIEVKRGSQTLKMKVKLGNR
ncbi:M28 family peptidase [Neorhodopirellula lusitana]|nr:M28 family peptidase [Neorhodopirellula lusitana]